LRRPVYRKAAWVASKPHVLKPWRSAVAANLACKRRLVGRWLVGNTPLPAGLARDWSGAQPGFCMPSGLAWLI
jgi:hypothetical protein